MKNKAIFFELLALMCILVVATYLRIYRVDVVPGWYNDEGTNINLAENLLKGRIEYFGVQGSMLFPARMPLFIWLLALVFRIFGIGINELRTLTGFIGIINTALIYLVLRKESKPLALICAMVFAILPKAVLYSRLGFSYNLLAMLALILFWACNQYLNTGQRHYAILGALILSLCLLSELVSAAYIPVFIIVILWKRWKDLWITLPIMIFPLVVYTVVMLWISPQVYRSDLQNTLFRVSSSTLPIQLLMILINSASIHQDLYMLIGVIGIFISPFTGLSKRLILFLFIPLLIISRTVTIGFLGWYYLIPLFPFYAIGIGILIFLFSKAMLSLSGKMFDQIHSRFPFRIHQSILLFIRSANNLIFIIILLIAPVLLSIYLMQTQIRENAYANDLEPVLADSSEASEIVNYINNNSDPNDLIIASPSIAWALKGNATDYHITLAYMGLSTTYFQNDVSHNRFRFNPSYPNAKFIIIDNLWMNWGEENLKDLVTIRHFAEQYPVVFKTKQILVYKIKNN
jgi:hypothetical protein